MAMISQHALLSAFTNIDYLLGTSVDGLDRYYMIESLSSGQPGLSN